MTETSGSNTEDHGSAQHNRWTRPEQLVAVFVAHLAVVTFVLVLILIFEAVPHMPWLFVAAEVGILLVCVWPLVRYEQIQKVFVGLGLAKESAQNTSPKERAVTLNRLAGYALLLAFTLQMAALIPLLKQTGGPIRSPFAQMTVALAIFTPFLANRPLTVASVGAIIAVYYVGLVTWMNNIRTEWPYLAVNLSILAVSVLLTFGDIRRRNRENRV